MCEQQDNHVAVYPARDGDYVQVWDAGGGTHPTDCSLNVRRNHATCDTRNRYVYPFVLSPCLATDR